MPPLVIRLMGTRHPDRPMPGRKTGISNVASNSWGSTSKGVPGSVR